MVTRHTRQIAAIAINSNTYIGEYVSAEKKKVDIIVRNYMNFFGIDN
jgi:hypothetical protein